MLKVWKPLVLTAMLTGLVLLSAQDTSAKDKGAAPESMVVEGTTFTVLNPKGAEYSFVDPSSVRPCQILTGATITVLSADSELTIVRLTQPTVTAPAEPAVKKQKYPSCDSKTYVAVRKTLGQLMLKQERFLPEPE